MRAARRSSRSRGVGAVGAAEGAMPPVCSMPSGTWLNRENVLSQQLSQGDLCRKQGIYVVLCYKVHWHITERNIYVNRGLRSAAQGFSLKPSIQGNLPLSQTFTRYAPAALSNNATGTYATGIHTMHRRIFIQIDGVLGHAGENWAVVRARKNTTRGILLH